MLKKIKTAAIVTVQVVFGVTGLMLALVAFTAASCLLFELFMNICFGIQTVSISPALRPIAINILIFVSGVLVGHWGIRFIDRKSTRLNSSHS